MSWPSACSKVEDYIVKIETPDGSGTGFFFAYNENRSLVAVATALHVISDAHDWRRPIKIRRVRANQEVFLPFPDRVVLVDYKRDSAAILFSANALKAPKDMLMLAPRDKYRAPGSRLSWGGYPGIVEDTLCFFQGSVSAFNQHNDSYYIDGVAINGVSGGPVFDEELKDQPTKIIGIVAAYFVNRQRGETLPGFSMAHDVTHLHDTIANIKTWDEGKKKEQKTREEQTEEAAAPEKRAPEARGGGNLKPEPKPTPGGD